MFRRRRGDDAADDLPADEPGLDAPDAAAPGERARPSGPWDLADLPAEQEAAARLDLGGLRIPVVGGLEARVEVDQQSQTVIAATLVDGQSALQVGVFAAPRSSGIWAEVRQEIAESLRTSGGSAEEVEGPFGTELAAQIPTDTPGQGVVAQPARFLGVDGPRWFLRGLLSGAAAVDPAAAARLEEAFRGIVVVRGGEAMAPRDPLPLHLPREAVQAAEQAAEAETDQRRPPPDPFERGPEITEVR